MNRFVQRSSLRFWRLVIFAVAANSFAAAASAQQKFQLDDFRDEVRLSGTALSPDGSRVVVVVGRPDYEQNRYVNQLLLIDCSNGNTRPLTSDRPNVRQPEWSPGGEQLAFIAADKDGKQQVFVISLSGGEAQAATNSDQDVVSFRWAPNGSTLAFTRATAAKEDGEKSKHNKSFEVTRDSFLAAGPSKPIHLWLLDLNEEREPRQLTSGNESVVSPFGTPYDFTPDGQALVYVARSAPAEGYFWDMTLNSVELASGKSRTLISKPNLLAVPRVSPDGDRVAYMAPRDQPPLFNPFTTFTIPLATGKPKDAAANLDRSVTGNWLPNSDTLLLRGVDRTRSTAWRQPLSGAARQLDLGDLHIGGYERELSSNAMGDVAFIGSGPGQPAEVYLLNLASGKPRQLTKLNAKLASKRAGKVETITWRCDDGLESNGILVYPPDYEPGQKLPLVLDIHGGPMWHSTEEFSLWRQVLAAQGWLVFCPNYRGSDNLGGRFQTAIINDAGDGPSRDIMAGVATLKQRGLVDEQKMAVSGWSYGGLLTVWLTAHHHDWKAAVAGAAVTDWLDQYNASDLNKWFGHGLGGSPWKNENRAHYLRQSPISYADQIRTPTLILSNTRDARVTVTQSYKLFRALRDNNVPVKFIAYPIDGHFPADPIHRDDVYSRWVSWIKKHFDQ